MTNIPWAQITDTETEIGIDPSSILFQKLVNNPRAVALGDPTVPYLKRILAEGTASPSAGVNGDFLAISIDGLNTMGTIDIPVFAQSFSILGSAGVTQGTVAATVSGLFTVYLQAAGGGGASAPGSSSQHNGGGGGGYARAVVTIEVGQLLEWSIGAAGAIDGDAADSYVKAVDESWIIRALGGKKGGIGAGFSFSGKGGQASLEGFAQGIALPGGTSYNILGGMSGHGLNGRGGEYNKAGRQGSLLIQRGPY